MVYIFPAVLLQLRQRNSNIFNFQGLNKLLDLKLASTGYPKSYASTIAIGKLLNLKFQIVAIVSNDTLLSLSIMCQYFQDIRIKMKNAVIPETQPNMCFFVIILMPIVHYPEFAW